MDAVDKPDSGETPDRELQTWVEPKLKVSPIKDVVKTGPGLMVESMTITTSS